MSFEKVHTSLVQQREPLCSINQMIDILYLYDMILISTIPIYMKYYPRSMLGYPVTYLHEVLSKMHACLSYPAMYTIHILFWLMRETPNHTGDVNYIMKIM